MPFEVDNKALYKITTALDTSLCLDASQRSGH